MANHLVVELTAVIIINPLILMVVEEQTLVVAIPQHLLEGLLLLVVIQVLVAVLQGEFPIQVREEHPRDSIRIAFAVWFLKRSPANHQFNQNYHYILMN